MKVSEKMNLNELAERMGRECTIDHADYMRDMLVDGGFEDTMDVPQDVWNSMLIDAVDAVR